MSERQSRATRKPARPFLARASGARRLLPALALVLSLAVLSGACFEDETGEQFYGKVAAPRGQEFRWSDGGLPQILDPARAAVPPDTDLVRAIFEGLTDYDPRTLQPLPAVANRWESTDGGRTWIFHLRKDARWSNGDLVTAHDFVRSWQRTLGLRGRAPHAKLLSNLEGAELTAAPAPAVAPQETGRTGDGATGVVTEGARQTLSDGAASLSRTGDARGAVDDAGRVAGVAESDGRATSAATTPETQPTPQAFGAVALDDYTLRVRLQRPDENFPALVAHPVFRPVHELSPSLDLPALRGEQPVQEPTDLASSVVTNGAFRLTTLAHNSLMLERAQNYWDAAKVKLERVSFVAMPDAEQAIAAYRAGEVDAVTNAAIEPLGLKLLTPYRDFRRQTFGALTYYRFNTARAPFNDRRVREALAIALDLDRLSADTLGGATEPAKRFLPPQMDAAQREAAAAKDDGRGGAKGKGHDEKPAAEEAAIKPLRQNTEAARRLLAEAGYPGGADFPRIRLLINRNDQQRQVAQTVARMWRDVLNVQTDVVIKNWEEYEVMLRAGDYDVARQSVVMQTTDEETNMLALFGDITSASAAAAANPAATASPPEASAAPPEGEQLTEHARQPPPVENQSPLMTEAQAMKELPAIPLYFASSYALVKPYVNGFESNLLDAPSLKRVSVDTGWQPPPKPEGLRIVWGSAK